MPDDRSKVGGQDRTRINIHEEHELRDWAQKFGVSQEKLKTAVAKVGDHAQAVARYLNGNRSR